MKIAILVPNFVARALLTKIVGALSKMRESVEEQNRGIILSLVKDEEKKGINLKFWIWGADLGN